MMIDRRKFALYRVHIFSITVYPYQCENFLKSTQLHNF